MKPSRWISATDLRIAVRLIRRQPIASVTSVLALATTIAVSVAAFTVARGFLFPDLPIADGDRLYQMRMHRAEPGSDEHPRPEEVLAWRRSATSFDSIGAFQFLQPALQIGNEASTPIEAARILPSAVARFTPPPILGRRLTDEDAAPGAPPVVVIGEAIWRKKFGADPAITGRIVMLAGTPTTIVGVLPAPWEFPVNQQAWLPLSLDRLAPERNAGNARSTPEARLFVWGILSKSSTPETASAELTALARTSAPSAVRVDVLPYIDGFTDGRGSIAATLVLAILLVFLCGVSLNVANLVLARCAARSGELAVRAALGASRARIVMQLFIESLVLGGIATGLGTFAVYRATAWISTRMNGQRMAFWLDLSVSPSVLIYSALLGVLASALAGIVPALRVTRGDSASTHLHGAGRRVAPVALGRFSTGLLSLQLATSLGMLATAGLLFEGLREYSKTSHTPHEDRILTAVLYRDPSVTGIDATWGSPELERLRLDIEHELRTLPQAEAVSVSQSLPRTDAEYGVLEMEAQSGIAPRARVQNVVAGPGFFETLGIELRAGRMFTSNDGRSGAPRVAVVSQRFVDDVLRGQSPLGQRFRWASTGEQPVAWIEIVGVVPDLRMNPGDRTGRGEVFTPLVGTNFMYAAVRFPGDPAALSSELRRAIARVDPRIRVTDVQRLADVGWEARAFLKSGTSVLALLGGMALLLSLAGIYALASLAVTSRTREIGIRRALGATPFEVLRATLRRSLIQLGLGTAGGIVLALLLSRATPLLPFAIPGTVSLAVPAASVLLVAAGLLASWIPARRALRIETMEALRAE